MSGITVHGYTSLSSTSWLSLPAAATMMTPRILASSNAYLKLADANVRHHQFVGPPRLRFTTSAPHAVAVRTACAICESVMSILKRIGSAIRPPVPAAPAPLFKTPVATLALPLPCHGAACPWLLDTLFIPPAV